jgi:hypothetical protein
MRDAVPGYDSFEEATVAATRTDASTILELGLPRVGRQRTGPALTATPHPAAAH